MTVTASHSHQTHGTRVHHAPTARTFKSVNDVQLIRMAPNTMNPLDTEGQTSWEIPHGSTLPNGFTKLSILAYSESANNTYCRRFFEDATQNFWILEGIGWLETEDCFGKTKKVEISAVYEKKRLPLQVVMPPCILYRIIPRCSQMLILSQQRGDFDPKTIHGEERFRELVSTLGLKKSSEAKKG